MSNVTRLVRPVRFTPDMLVSWSAANEHADWVAGTYADGDRVEHAVVATKGYMKGLLEERSWESLAAGNTAVPGTDPTKWLDLGYSNRTRMFDTKVSSQSEDTGFLNVELAVGELVTSVAFLNVLGVSIQLRVLDDITEIYNETVDLLDDAVTDWFEYFTAEVEQTTKAFFDGIPCYPSSRLIVAVNPGSGAMSPSAVGHMVFGRSFVIGYSPELGASSGTQDFSKKETDEFGETEFVERPYADENSLVLRVPKPRINAVARLLREVRGPCLLLGSDDTAYSEVLVSFGWIREHRMVVAYHESAMLDIDFGGLT